MYASHEECKLLSILDGSLWSGDARNFDEDEIAPDMSKATGPKSGDDDDDDDDNDDNDDKADNDDMARPEVSKCTSSCVLVYFLSPEGIFVQKFAIARVSGWQESRAVPSKV